MRAHRIQSTRKMNEAVWRACGRSSWWVKLGPQPSAPVIEIASAPGCAYLDTVVLVEPNVDRVFVGAGPGGRGGVRETVVLRRDASGVRAAPAWRDATIARLLARRGLRLVSPVEPERIDVAVRVEASLVPGAIEIVVTGERLRSRATAIVLEDGTLRLTAADTPEDLFLVAGALERLVDAPERVLDLGSDRGQNTFE